MRQLNRNEAIAFGRGGEWKNWTPKQRGAFQLQQNLLCMDFDAFHEGVQALLGRPVFTHEFAYKDQLIDEWKGRKDAPTFDEIVALIPEGKRIIIEAAPKEPT